MTTDRLRQPLPRWAVGLLLAVILALAAVLRFTGLNWDEGQHLHPDERFLMMVVNDLDRPGSLAEYFDSARSPLNPRNRGFSTFVYGTLPTTLLHFAGAATGREHYGDLLLVGRALSAAFDLGTVLLCFLLGILVSRRAAGGLIAALLYAASVLAIQQAHFFVVDSFATFFTIASLTVLLWVQHRSVFWKWLLAGAFWGAALACKLSVYTFAVIPVLLALWQAWEPGRGLRRDEEPRAAAIERALLRAAAFAAAAFVVLRIAMPDAFRGPGLLGIVPDARWLANMDEARRLVSGQVDFPPGHQWTARTRYWFPWWNMVLWGMGPALGLLAWSALAVAAVRLWRGMHARLLLLAAWVALLFAHQGGQWVMSMRYFLPIYPAFAALAAWLLLDLRRTESPSRIRRLQPPIAAVVLGATLLWAIAFTSIYRSPHSRIEASRWLLANIPAGSHIGNEVWDDALPLRIDGRDPFGNEYRGIDMHWYAEDEPQKLLDALQWLEDADVLVLSSNRLHDSIPRLWMRYPMTTRYYEALFAGELGFDLAAEFHSYPRLMGIQFRDTAAEEAFSVYDHPRVLVYRKADDYDRTVVERIHSEAMAQEPLRLTPLEEARAPGALRFTRDQWEYKQRHDLPIPERSTRGDLASSLLFLFWLLLIGPLTAPILFAMAPGLPDRGLSLARPIGLGLVAWIAWLMASHRLVPFTAAAILAVILLLGCISIALAWQRRSEWRAFLAARWGLVAAGEAVFLAAFLAMAILRWLNPDLWHPSLGGEKPMDMAYLNAVLRTPDFPPHAPWHSGSVMNYYYFGYVLAAVPIKLSGIAGEVGYNLAVAAFFALFASAAFGVGASLAHQSSSTCRRVVTGLSATVLAAIAGNLAQTKVVWHNLIHNAVRPESWFWDATRAIAHPPGEAGPITEFPYFTFLFADLHPHLMALPFFAALIGIAIARSRHPAQHLALDALAAFVLGLLWITNPWEFPTGALLILLSLVMACRTPGQRPLLRACIEWLVILLAARLLFLPFHARFGSAYGAFELWRGSRTPLADYLWINGGFLAIVVALLFVEGRYLMPIVRRRWLPILVAATLALLTMSVLPLPILLLLCLLGVAVALVRQWSSDELAWPLLLAGIALGIGLFVEFVVLKNDISRMNTVFKFYLQAWVLLAIASAAIVQALDRRLRGAARLSWRVAVGVVVAAMLLYPLTATFPRTRHRMEPAAPRTLDGLRFLQQASLQHEGAPILLQDDLAGIRWLRRNASGLPVIVEATTHPVLYGWGGRFSSHTGLPAIVGWDWHQKQQFAALPFDVVTPRIDDLKHLYSTTNPEEAWQILSHYNAEWLIVGALERALYPPEGIAKFAAGEGKWWTREFQSGSLEIYRVTAPR